MKIQVLHHVIDWKRLAQDSAPRQTTASLVAAVAEEKAAVAPRDPFEAHGYDDDSDAPVAQPKKQLATIGDALGAALEKVGT